MKPLWDPLADTHTVASQFMVDFHTPTTQWNDERDKTERVIAHAMIVRAEKKREFNLL